MNPRRGLLALLALALSGCATPPPDLISLAEQVRASEIAFAASMAARDFPAFSGWVADDATFINSGKPLRGKVAVLAHWQRFPRTGGTVQLEARDRRGAGQRPAGLFRRAGQCPRRYAGGPLFQHLAARTFGRLANRARQRLRNLQLRQAGHRKMRASPRRP